MSTFCFLLIEYVITYPSGFTQHILEKWIPLENQFLFSSAKQIPCECLWLNSAISAPVNALWTLAWHFRCSRFLNWVNHNPSDGYIFDCAQRLPWLFSIGGWVQSPNCKITSQTEYCGTNLAAASVLTRPYKETINVVVGRHDVMWHHAHTYTFAHSGSVIRQGSMKKGRDRSWTGDRGAQAYFI